MLAVAVSVIVPPDWAKLKMVDFATDKHGPMLHEWGDRGADEIAFFGWRVLGVYVVYLPEGILRPGSWVIWSLWPRHPLPVAGPSWRPGTRNGPLATGNLQLGFLDCGETTEIDETKALSQ